MDAKRLLEIANELRRMIRELDESEAERNIAAAIVYLDCARFNLTGQGKYKVIPQVVTDYPLEKPIPA
jgi:hypothetical protein